MVRRDILRSCSETGCFLVFGGKSPGALRALPRLAFGIAVLEQTTHGKPSSPRQTALVLVI